MAKKKEFCKRGHARTPDNLTKASQCKICAAAGNAARWSKREKRRVPAAEKLTTTEIYPPPGRTFNSFDHCSRDNGQFMCKHYSSCTDERVFEEKKQSDRYVQLAGKCFELGDKDKIMEF